MTPTPPTPDDYAALRWRLEGFTGSSTNTHWPLVRLAPPECPACASTDCFVEDGDVPWGFVRADTRGCVSFSAGSLELTCCDCGHTWLHEPTEAIAARAAWWSRLTAPRREAEADPEADAVLKVGAEFLRAQGYVVLYDGMGYDRHVERVAHLNEIPTEHVEWNDIAEWVWQHGLTTAQLRARLAFKDATGVPCENCSGVPRRFDPGWRCLACNATGRILPEPVPQDDPARGVERCGCVRGREWAIVAWMTPIDGPPHACYAKRDCIFCAGTGAVRDGRRVAGDREYAAREEAPQADQATGQTTDQEGPA